jgi:hypothetical protein
MTVFERFCRASGRLLSRSALAVPLACGIFSGPAATAQATQETRVALVIGNGAYPGAPLVNPGRDARVIAQALRTMGFTVLEGQDVGKAEFGQLVAQARQLLEGRHGIGMLYFAGHGMQLDWHNYMIPVDARLASAADVRAQTVSVDEIVDAFRAAGTRANIFVLDACRDNPFGAAAAGKGLAPVDAPSGSVFAYATAPGNVAADGDAGGGNGLYTQFLVREMARPGARIEDVFKRVRFQVRQLSRGKQIPWESTSLEGDFFFRPPLASDADASASRERVLKQEIADWKQIQNSTDPDDVYRFLSAHPSGSLSEVALARLERLDKSAVIPNSVAGQSASPPPGRRYRLGDVYDFAAKDFVTGEELRRFRWRVTSIEGDIVRFNDGAFIATQSGADIKTSEGTFDPPVVSLPASDFQVGDTITSRTRFSPARGARVWREYVTRVVAYEKVTVMAGTFMAYRLETVMTSEDGATAKGIRWVDPEWGQSLRTEWTGRDPRYGQSWGQIREVVSLRKGREEEMAVPVSSGEPRLVAADPFDVSGAKAPIGDGGRDSSKRSGDD